MEGLSQADPSLAIASVRALCLRGGPLCRSSATSLQAELSEWAWDALCSGFEFWLHLLPAVWTQALSSLSLSFLICKVGVK